MSEQMTVEEADKLYEGYGKALEKDHHGEYAAICPDGRVIVGKNDIEVVDRAISELGSGSFVLYRIGYKYVGKISCIPTQIFGPPMRSPLGLERQKGLRRAALPLKI